MKRSRNILGIAAIIGTLAFTAVAQTSLKSVDGEQIDIQRQSGKAVILAVGASWLPLSAKQAEFTNSLARKYAGKNVAIFFVLTDSINSKSKNHATDEELRAWATKNRVSVKILRDPDGAGTLRKFSIDQLPSFVVLDKGGNASGEPFGGVDPNFDITVPISKKVDSLL